MGDTKRIAMDIYGKEVAEREDLEDIINDMLAVLPRVEEEYLVSDARLTCSKACPSIKSIDGIDFFTNQSGTSLLRVEGAEIIDDMHIGMCLHLMKIFEVKCYGM